MSDSKATQASDSRDVRDLLGQLLGDLTAHDFEGTRPTRRDVRGWISDVFVISEAFDALSEASGAPDYESMIQVRIARELPDHSTLHVIEVLIRVG